MVAASLYLLHIYVGRILFVHIMVIYLNKSYEDIFFMYQCVLYNKSDCLACAYAFTLVLIILPSLFPLSVVCHSELSQFLFNSGTAHI